MAKVEINTAEAQPTNEDAIAELKEQGINIETGADADGNRAIATEPNIDAQTIENQRPEWLPEKFNSAEELAKSYNELEKSYSEKSTATQNDLNPFFEEWTDKGELAEDSYKKLEGMGLPKDIVDNYIAGQKAQGDLQVSTITNAVGGTEEYNKMVEWASANLTVTEQNTFNNSMENGSTDEAQLAVKGINAMYKSTQTSTQSNTPRLVQGEGTAPADIFRSTAEVVKAINNPKYNEDTAYRKEVEQKIQRSGIM